MGDTSLNALVYSPTTKRLDGKDIDLDALCDGRIRFTEPHKAEKLSEPDSIAHTGAKGMWPSTILRLALRAIRLAIDLELAPNPSGLTMDVSFDTVLRGFPLYFDTVALDKVGKFRLDAAYVEQFVKIFRNRKPAELKAINTLLGTRFAESLPYFKALGLDVAALVKNAATTTDRDDSSRCKRRSATRASTYCGHWSPRHGISATR